MATKNTKADADVRQEVKKDKVLAPNGMECTHMVNVAKPRTESAQAFKLLVNGRPYMITYGKATPVPAEVYHALKDAVVVESEKKRMPDGTTANMPVEIPRFTFSGNEI